MSGTRDLGSSAELASKPARAACGLEPPSTSPAAWPADLLQSLRADLREFAAQTGRDLAAIARTGGDPGSMYEQLLYDPGGELEAAALDAGPSDEYGAGLESARPRRRGSRAGRRHKRRPAEQD